jgi:DUF1680 family protein
MKSNQNFLMYINCLMPLMLLTVVSCTTAKPAGTVKMVSFDQVKMDDTIWAPRIATLAKVTLPHAFKQTEVGQERLRMCAEYLENGGGPKPMTHLFNTSDVYKVMEGAAMMIQAEPNPAIEAQMDRIIDVIARAQKEDGYLYVSHICGNPNTGTMGRRPYSHVILSHELYNMGHLYEAAVAYARATGKEKLLAVAEKNASHVNKVFFLGDPNYNDGKPVNLPPGHQEIEIGLVKLYNYTGNKLYLDIAKRFLDIRGLTSDHIDWRTPDYSQQHAPVAQQREAVGHAVRATYMYTAMAEVDSLLGAEDYTKALDSIWHDIVDTKMHITGGLGAVHGIEGFGPSYKLPNKDAYLETCAAIGNVFFNMRMFLKYHDAKYIDVAEIALLNNCLSGIGLDGKSFFYPNPLEADKDHTPRSGWFGCACCPPNVARLILQVSGYMYATDGTELYCNLYGGSTTAIKLNGKKVELRQITDYPYSGDINFELTPERKTKFKLHLRIPTWATGQLVPGELYSYSQSSRGWSLKVNGKKITPVVEKGFAVIDRTWKKGDKITLKLPMPVKMNTCINEVQANRGRVSFSRGPLVYCAEGIDNGGAVQRFYLDPDAAMAGAKVSRIDSGKLTGLRQITVPIKEINQKKDTNPKLKMIPYFAWSNRDRSSMITWIGTSKDLARPDPDNPANMKFASVKASHTCKRDTVNAIRMSNTPKSSSDTSIPRWTSWPQKGRSQWVEISLGKIKQVRSLGVYWFNDNDGVQLPGAWHLEAPGENGWTKVEIYTTDQYSTLADNYNTVHPDKTLKTDKLRIVIDPKHDQTCVGILSVNIDSK